MFYLEKVHATHIIRLLYSWKYQQIYSRKPHRSLDRRIIAWHVGDRVISCVQKCQLNAVFIENKKKKNIYIYKRQS